MDLLTDVLQAVHLRGAVHADATLTAPWGLLVEPRPNQADFHMVTAGAALLEVEGTAPVSLRAGDVVILPQSRSYTLRDASETPAEPIERLGGACPLEHAFTVHHGGGGVESRMLLGSFRFDGAEFNPFLDALPPVLHFREHEGTFVPWLEQTLQFIAAEATSGRTGAEATVSRLTEVLFIQTIRAYVEGLPETCPDGGHRSDWLRAMTDEQLGRALLAIHRAPEQAWSVEALASEALMSRTAFATRFAQVLGTTPLRYVTRWRLYKSALALRRQGLSLVEAAEVAGYESEAAFSKAFKREMGLSPSVYRAHGGRKSRGQYGEGVGLA